MWNKFLNIKRYSEMRNNIYGCGTLDNYYTPDDYFCQILKKTL